MVPAAPAPQGFGFPSQTPPPLGTPVDWLSGARGGAYQMEKIGPTDSSLPCPKLASLGWATPSPCGHSLSSLLIFLSPPEKAPQSQFVVTAKSLHLNPISWGSGLFQGGAELGSRRGCSVVLSQTCVTFTYPQVQRPLPGKALDVVLLEKTWPHP
ncbi:hypothetical protein P7K49_029198 [Saguinus oedipus]|uniref:Uncharacterized protein n=1 Tax=Saguinus oedipus TaxID=9490 RepID=A0ABQ9U6I3_SAGOE|nr:hypothetical protein P7K49_029198 [Saguinus oedipus]